MPPSLSKCTGLSNKVFYASLKSAIPFCILLASIFSTWMSGVLYNNNKGTEDEERYAIALGISIAILVISFLPTAYYFLEYAKYQSQYFQSGCFPILGPPGVWTIGKSGKYRF